MSFPWSEKDLKGAPVGNDEVMLIDSEDTNPESINKRALLSSLPSAGQTNTSSNQGGGTELALAKDGVDLPFRTLFGETDKIELTQNTEDVTFTLGSLVVTTDQANTYNAGEKQSFVSSATTAAININTQIPSTTVTGDIWRTAEFIQFKGTSSIIRTTVITEEAQTLTDKTLIEPIISTIENSGLITLPTGPETLVGLDTIDTLTNKTLITPIISDIENSGNLSLPTGADTLVGRVSTDTLTNKTLTAPIISIIENSGIITLPTGPVTLVGRDTTDTFTNKTFDANATGNSLDNVDVADLADGIDGELITWDSAGAPTTVSTGLVNQVLTSNGAGLSPEFKDPTTGTLSIVRLEGSDISTNRLALNFLDTTNQIDFLVSDDAGNSESEISATISTSYVGQASITTLGTISTGTWEGSTVTVPFGGTGTTTFTDNGVLFGNDTGTIGATSVGTAGQILKSNGVGLAPSFQDAASVPLSDTNIFVGDATNLAVGVAVTGDIAIDNTGLVSISSDVIVNADVNSSAAIDFSKLATLATGQIIVGDGGVPTAATMSGDATINNTGVVSLIATVVKTDQANTYGNFAQIFPFDMLLIQNPAQTATFQITGSAIASNRVVTLPILLGNDTFVTEAFTQTLSNKTLMDVRMTSAGSINDVNGNELIQFPSAIASAVNEIEILNAVTGVGPTITSSGEVNIDLNIDADGTGEINLLKDVNVTGDLVMGDRLQETQGTDVPSPGGGILTLGDGNVFTITGTNTINEILATGWQAGSEITLEFAAVLTVTNNSGGTNDILLRDGDDYTSAAGESLELWFDGTDWNELSRTNTYPEQSTTLFANNDATDQSIGSGAGQTTITGLTSTTLPNRPGRFAMISAVVNASSGNNSRDMFYAIAEGGTPGTGTGIFYSASDEIDSFTFSVMVEMTGQVITVVADPSKASNAPGTLTVITDNTSNFQSKMQVTLLG